MTGDTAPLCLLALPVNIARHGRPKVWACHAIPGWLLITGFVREVLAQQRTEVMALALALCLGTGAMGCAAKEKPRINWSIVTKTECYQYPGQTTACLRWHEQADIAIRVAANRYVHRQPRKRRCGSLL